ncbi:MAG: hypothetical protein E7453_02430 [Ruminococcaceae bacterium]|nr:hypothetical protein [Oscillospiraceae bacterium]
MKNAKVLKPLLLSAAAVMLVVATMLATMAYLTASSAVSNVFTVGNVSMQMFETKVNSDGTPAEGVVPGAMKTADTNSYHLQPGMSYKKDPTIYVDPNSDESYLFVRLRNDLKTIERQNDPDHLTIVEQLRKNGWLEIERADSNVDAVFVYVGQDVTERYAAASATVDAEIENGGVAVGYAERANRIREELADIPAKPVGKVENDTYIKVNGHQAIDVFEEFTLATKVPELGMYGGARVAIVAYAIQTNGVSVHNKYSEDAYMDAWAVVKTELPFVN